MGGNRALRKPSDRQIMVQSANFQGPIPPPSILKGYAEVIPSAPERILAMAESQSAHRQELEKMVIQGDSLRSTRGQLFGFIVAMTVVIGGIGMIFAGKDVLGLSAILGSLATLTGVFVYGSNARRKEREKKLAEAKRGI